MIFVVTSDSTLLCPCGKQFQKNKAGKCPVCKAITASPIKYSVNVLAYGGRGSCTCKLFRLSIRPIWESGDFSAPPCKHLVGTGTEGVFSLYGRLMAVEKAKQP